MKKIILLSMLFVPLCASAQDKPLSGSWNLHYVSEGIYNVSNGRATWVNILDAGFVLNLPSEMTFEVNMLSVNNVRSSNGRAGVIDGVPIFSEVEQRSVPLSLYVLGLSKRFGALELFVGVRNLNADYFAAPWNSIFTSPVSRINPCISANFPIADAPESALALHADVNFSPRWQLQASLYNGVASHKWDEVFRFRPRHDGVFLISELSYSGEGNGNWGNYRVGGAWGDVRIASADRKEVRRTLWALAEQPLWRSDAGDMVELILHGGLSPKSECDTYFGGGGRWTGVTDVKDYIGLMYTRSLYSAGNESAYELTYAYPAGHAVLQTALHYVHSPHHDNFIGMVKVVLGF